MDQVQSSTKTEINAARTKAIDMIQRALPELPTQELVLLASIAVSFHRLANVEAYFAKAQSIIAGTNGKVTNVGHE